MSSDSSSEDLSESFRKMLIASKSRAEILHANNVTNQLEKLAIDASSSMLENRGVVASYNIHERRPSADFVEMLFDSIDRDVSSEGNFSQESYQHSTLDLTPSFIEIIQIDSSLQTSYSDIDLLDSSSDCENGAHVY